MGCDCGEIGEKNKPFSVPSLFSLWFSCHSKKAGNAVRLRDLLDIEDSLKIHLFENFFLKSTLEFVSFEVICYTRLL